MSKSVENLIEKIEAEDNRLQYLALFEIANYLMETHGASRSDAVDAVETYYGHDIVPGGSAK